VKTQRSLRYSIRWSGGSAGSARPERPAETEPRSRALVHGILVSFVLLAAFGIAVVVSPGHAIGGHFTAHRRQPVIQTAFPAADGSARSCGNRAIPWMYAGTNGPGQPWMYSAADGRPWMYAGTGGRPWMYGETNDPGRPWMYSAADGRPWMYGQVGRTTRSRDCLARSRLPGTATVAPVNVNLVTRSA